MSHEPLLCVNALQFSYDQKRTIFDQVSFTLNPGDIFSILGANGSGKTTLLNCLSGQLTPARGDVLLKNESIHKISPAELARSVGYVSQLQPLPFNFCVRDYLVLGRAPHIGLLRSPGKKKYRLVDQVMDDMKISFLANKSMQEISGGERQQVQIARVLVQQPRLILMDEPTNHLDYGNQIKILKLIVNLAQKENMAVILTTHMPDHAMLLGSKTGMLKNDGSLICGTACKILTEENLKEIYQTDLHMIYVPELSRTACLPGNLID